MIVEMGAAERGKDLKVAGEIIDGKGGVVELKSVGKRGKDAIFFSLREESLSRGKAG